MTAFDALNLLLPVMGAFYVAAAWNVGRMARLGAVLDAAIAGLSAERRSPMDKERTFWLFATGAVAGLGGLLLLVDSALAAPVFVAGCVMQVAHFLWLSPRRYDVDHPIAPDDRARSLRASALYASTTALVVGSTFGGLLKNPDQMSAWLLPCVGSVWLGWIVWVCRDLLGTEVSRADTALSRQQEQSELVVRVSPTFAPTCLFNLHSGDPLFDYEVEALFPRPLLDRARHYMLLFRRLADPHDPRRQALRDPTFQDILNREGELLVEAMQAHHPGRVVLEAGQRQLDFPEPVEAIEVSPVVWINPVWAPLPGEDEPRMLNPDWIGVSWSLGQDLYAWAEAFDSVNDPDVGGRGPQWSPGEAARHAEWGRALAQRLADELAATNRSHVVVTFRPHGGMAELVSHHAPKTAA